MKPMSGALGKLLLLRFPIILAVFVIMLPVSYIGLSEIADGVNGQLYYSARLEEASRLELEANTLFSQADAFARGLGDASIEQVQLSLDLFWSRVDVMTTKSYRQVQADEKLDEAFTQELMDSLPRLEAAVAALEFGNRDSYRQVDAFALAYRDRIIAFSEEANVARRQHLADAVAEQLQSVTNLKQIQFGYVVLGIAATIYVMLELVVARRLNKRLNSSISEKQSLLFTDHLTGIGNRLSFETRLTELKSEKTVPFGVIYFDLDGFKQVNDTLGHAMGDKLLKHVANALRVIAEDGGAFPFRFGGDEFAVITLGGREVAQRFAERAVQRISLPALLEGATLQVSASAGFTHLSDLAKGEGVEALMVKADLALYAAKSAGRNCVQPYRAELGSESDRRIQLEAAASSLLRDKAMEVAFEPICSLRSGKIWGLKVVPHWIDEKFGPVAPDEVLQLAEAVHGASDLFFAMLSTTLETLARTINQKGIAVCFETSESVLGQNDFAHLLFEQLYRSGVPPSSLQLQLSGACSPDPSAAITENVRALREAGVIFATAKLGQVLGTSATLSSLDLHVLHLSGWHVAKARRNARCQRLIEGLNAFAQKVDATLVAWGVETHADIEYLIDTGVELGSGRALMPMLTPQDLSTVFPDTQRHPEQKSASRTADQSRARTG